ncbi:hypothetical protein M0R45_012499 [Rubus argutus]|uniref:Uncharacterized protein n=1 Tax=Rubus argutus TaxID=59490 RepID=A0AAW1YEE7_RUBAR
MADKRQFFRFRFPWRKNPRPTEEPEPLPTTTAKTQNPAQSAPTVPVERSPFRSAGKAPAKGSPSQAQAPHKNDPPPASPSRAASESQKPQSPSRLSLSKTSQPTTQQTSPPSPASSQSQPLRESQPKIEIISETVSNAQDSSPRESAFQNHETSPKTVDIFASDDNSDSDTLGGDHKQLSESETDSKEHKEEEKVVQVPTVEEKNKDQEPIQERVTEVHAATTDSGNQAKDPLGVALQAEQQQHKQETHDKKEILAATDSDDTPNKTASSRMSIRKMVSSPEEQAPPNKEIREDDSKVDKLAATGQQMLEKPASVVTLIGENRGATMLSEPAKQEESVHIRYSNKLDPDDSAEATTTDGKVSDTEEIFEDEMSTERRVFINSNVQSINNSILFNSSVTERNPGVAVFSRNPSESIFSNGNSGSLQTHKAQIIQTPADKLTHESTVRRRCLRGLLMESSDSEPDNHEKPRRHGCRYICGKERRETEIGIV